MAKRGERFPWRVTFRWDTGISGRIPCTDEWTANHKADGIRRAAELQDRKVTVEVVQA